MTEAEWKIFRQVREAALERLCGRIMEQSQKAMQGPGTNHERYLRLFQAVHDGDKEVAWAFNDFRRSTADQILAVMARLRLVTDDELARFQPNTQEFVRAMVRG
ncbi:MAG TPA: hypothetical protein VFJ82_05945 [Longimicrobium sp.]|nr:hypothetical protein [Longimicrobium sp.]